MCSDCFTAFLKLSSNEESLYTIGHFVSQRLPPISKSGVLEPLIFDGLIKTTSRPRFEKYQAVLCSLELGGLFRAEMSTSPSLYFFIRFTVA